ncbi:MAG: zinc-binding alcohol dehydrogenase [Mesorhizobium sp.]|uniref:alcohol dehydrogenase catalytic domain-containing protein n=1 Tax=Mesorhizobium sp. TaxID=1871066 RepID=UPI00120E56DF|nr:alcohol dehydrogenase catalytic domain-containing protein [Mesorhizobium sp.]TIO77797.1 MAG: zinc-binding alcohol dehydrogenase [Mesorhizobium sp.]TIO85611.1 MAG: zinc-binding alcohol dehydrogenase [Mesorhizobium sp.]
MTSHTQTMRAAVLGSYGEPLDVANVPRPVAGPGQILVRLQACGVCHTDVHIWRGESVPPHAPSPFVMGHEGVGRVEAIGEGVSNWSLGDRTGVPWIHDTCCHCDECLDGYESFCQHHRAHGLNVPGAFAEYVVCDARFAVALPETIDPVTTASVMCAGITAYGAVKRAGLKAGDSAIVFGCGGLGLYAVQIASRLGVKVLAVDRDPAKLDIARRYGAAETEIADTGLPSRLAARDNKHHACINFAPTTATWDAMVAGIRPRGRIIAAAMVFQPVPLIQEWLTATGVVITGTSVGTRQEMRELVAMHAEQPLETTVETIRLDDVSAALATLERGQSKGRFVISFTG